MAQAQAAALPSLAARGAEGARDYLDANAARSAPGPDMAHVEDGNAAGVPVRVYRPSADGPLPVVTYLHGGGWVIGGISSSDAFCRRLAAAAGCVVVSVGYRLAPEHPFPAGVDDAVAAIGWVAERRGELGGADRPHVVVGDSAGGNIATVAVRRLLRSGGPPIDRQVLAYPTIDTTQDRPSHSRHGSSWPLLSSDLAWFVGLYAPDEAQRRHPDVCPLLADVAGMPRTTLLIAGCDPLRDEGIAYAEHLSAAGVAVDLHVFEGQIHGFLTMPEETLPTSREALGVVANAVRYA